MEKNFNTPAQVRKRIAAIRKGIASEKRLQKMMGLEKRLHGEWMELIYQREIAEGWK